jgi:hypothetical protein
MGLYSFNKHFDSIPQSFFLMQACGSAVKSFVTSRSLYTSSGTIHVSAKLHKVVDYHAESGK